MGGRACIAIQLTSALALVHKRRPDPPRPEAGERDGARRRHGQLLDFGIARANGEATITQHGMLVGTVLYMSPSRCAARMI